MKNDDKKIPATKVTLSPYASERSVRNRTVVRVSPAERSSIERKRPERFEEAPERRPGETGSFFEVAERPVKADNFVKAPNVRSKESGNIWAAMDNRPERESGFSEPEREAAFDSRSKKPNGFSDNREYRSKKQNSFFEDGEGGFYQREGKQSYAPAYKRAAGGSPDMDIPFGSFIVEVLFSALLLSAVCALMTVRIGGEGGVISFSYPGSSLWAYICISVGAFALLRIFFRMQYFTSVFVAFGTLFALNLGWLESIARLLLGEGSAPIGGIVLYIILLAGFFFLLFFLYKKSFKPHMVVKVLGVALALLVLLNMGVNWPV